MIIADEEYAEVNKWALRLEQASFDMVRQAVNDLSWDADIEERFYDWLYDLDIFFVLAEHKIKLAKFLAQASRVRALENDRTRIVFCLAGLYGQDIDTINKTLAAEFGPHFKLLNNYNVGNKVVGWKQIVRRAAEIKNGFYNHDRLQADSTVTDMINFYKIFSPKEPQKLEEIMDLSDAIIDYADKSTLTSLASPSANDIREKTVKFYKLIGRANIDITNVKETTVQNVANFAYKAKYACVVRLALLRNNIQVDNYDAAYDYLSNLMAENYSHTYTTAEELQRIGQPLEPVVN